MTPVILRHRDALRQSALYGTFAVLVASLLIFVFWVGFPGRILIAVVLVPLLAFLTYSAVRLATLRVRLDDSGVWEPNPFRLTYVTPWADVSHVRQVSEPGRMKMRFITLEMVHADKSTHPMVALQMNAGVGYAADQLREWQEAVEAAKVQVLGR